MRLDPMEIIKTNHDTKTFKKTTLTREALVSIAADITNQPGRMAMATFGKNESP